MIISLFRKNSYYSFLKSNIFFINENMNCLLLNIFFIEIYFRLWNICKYGSLDIYNICVQYLLFKLEGHRG